MLNVKSLPLISTGVGLKVVGMDGSIYTRTNQSENLSEDANYIVTLRNQLMGNIIETVTTIKHGRLGIEPVIVPNKVFMDSESGEYFILAREDNIDEVEKMSCEAKCGYIYPAKQNDGKYRPVARLNGKVVKTPRVLINECGVSYHMIEDLVAYGEVCKRAKGYMLAQKVVPVYLLPSKPGDTIATVVNGVQEHTTVIEEGEVKVQNPGGEAYKMREAKLHKLYDFAETTAEGYQLWRPKQELQKWVRSGVNIICILWGGFEVLVTPLININDAKDTYGCNYQVFFGSDTTEGTHEVRKIFLPVEPITHQLGISSVLLNGYVRTLEGIPKMEYVEAPDMLLLASLLKSA